MRKNVASCAVACALGCPGLVLAQDKGTYRAEVGLDYFRADTDTSRSSAAGLTGTYYFDALPAAPQDYPLEAGAFVERAASVSAMYSRTSQDSDNFQTLRNGSSHGAGFVFRRPDLPLYVAASYRRSDGGKLRSSAGTEVEFEGESYRVTAGGYVAKRTLLLLNWSRSTSESNNLFTSGNILLKSANTSVGIGGTHLAQLPNGNHLALGGSVTQTRYASDGVPSEKNNGISLAGTYYPTKMLGLTLGYGSERGDARFAEGDTLSAGVSWFVTPKIGLSVDVLRFQAKAQNSDYDAIFLGARVRF